MNLLTVVSNTIKSILNVIDTTTTSVLPKALSGLENCVDAADIASETIVVSGIIESEKDIVGLLKANPEVSPSRVNIRLEKRGKKFTVPVLPVVINQPVTE